MNITSEIRETLVVIRGAGDLATGTAIRLHRCGFRVVMLEVPCPTVIRTTVSFATAVFRKEYTVEGITAKLCRISEISEIFRENRIPVIIDPEGESIRQLRPRFVVDAIIAKKNTGTTKDMADFIVALGPGFRAGEDCHAVIETKRGHTLGRVIYEGSAIPNTGIPGVIGGYGKERVMHSPCAGVFRSFLKIGDIVEAGDTVAFVGDMPVKTEIAGKLRGLLTDGLEVPEHFKIADVDPRGEKADHTTCSDKAMSIAGGVLEAILHFMTDSVAETETENSEKQ